MYVSCPSPINTNRCVEESRRTHDAVEFGALVALGASLVVLGLARAKLSEVLGRPRYHVFEELKSDAAEGLT